MSDHLTYSELYAELSVSLVLFAVLALPKLIGCLAYIMVPQYSIKASEIAYGQGIMLVTCHCFIFQWYLLYVFRHDAVPL